jgi:hypothetical protein
MKNLLLASLLALGGCTIFVEEPDIVVEPYPYYVPYHYVWVQDPYSHVWIRRMVP